MKRGAEKQLRKDDLDDDDNEEGSEPGRGLQVADAAELKNRPMRGMPKRASRTPTGTPPPTSRDDEPAPPPKFAGFAGLGTSASATNPFTFTPPASSSGSVFGSKPSESPFSSSPSTAPSVAPSASSAVKTFASFLGPNTGTSSPPKTSSPASNDEVDPAAFKYYTSLRGLNISVMNALSQAVDKDPFVDVTQVLDRYRELRVSVQKDFDEKSKTSGNTKAPSASTSTSNIFGGPSKDASSKAAPSSKPPSSMPAPPATFAGFTMPSSSSSSGSPSFGGFTPRVDDKKPAASSGFSFPPSTASSTEAPKPLQPSGFSFGSASSSTASTKPADSSKSATSSSDSGSSNAAPTPPSTQSPFSFGASNTASAKTSFGSTPTDSASKPSPFGTSGSSFGSTSAFGAFKPSASPFSTTPASTDKDKSDGSSAAKPSSNLFGGAAFGTTSSKSAAAPSPFSGGFGARPNAFGFGTPTGKSPASGSIGNPVGFGFGSPPKTPDEPSTAAAKPTGFSFGVPPPKGAEGTATPTEEDSADAGSSAEGGGDDSSKLLPSKSHDEEGEGEEDEETTYTVKTKVYKLVKGGPDGDKWGDMGVGMVRLKKHKTTEARRVLLRNSSTGKITINFNMYVGLAPSLTGKVVSLVGHEAGSPTPYKLRVKTDEQAAELKEALDREIAFVKASKESD